MLGHADEFLHAGDLVQASEKGWGAAAHYMKAVVKQRGWTNRSHRDFFTIKDRLANETNDPGRISLLFREANALHQNFYEPLYLPSDVRGGIDSAKEFIGLLEEAAVLRDPPTDTLNGTGQDEINGNI